MAFTQDVLPVLLRFLLNLVVPPGAVVYLAGNVLPMFEIELETWQTTLAAIFAIPATFAARIIARQMNIRYEAARIGAQPLPTVRGWLPGNFDMLLRSIKEFTVGYPADYIYNELVPKYGHTFNFRLMWDDMVFTDQPEYIKTVLATDFANYEKGPVFNAMMNSVLGVGVFNADGDMWKFHRTMTRPFFSRDRVSDFDIFDAHAEEALSKLKQRTQAGYAVDFQDLIARFTLDSATEFLFGSCVNSLSTSLPYPHNVPTPAGDRGSTASEDFARAFAAAQDLIADRARVGWMWPLKELFKDRTVESMKVVDAYLDPILKDAVRKAQETPTEEKSSEVEGQTLLDHLVKFTSDPKVLHDETLNILIAGRDTTAATLTFVVYFLATHPEVMTRLREEVITHVGPTRRPGFDDIKNMKYLRAVINETLRLYPAVPFNRRMNINATTWPNPDPNGKPFYLPAGTTVAYSDFMMHRRKDLWGPDAEEFDPDRFIDQRLKTYITPNPFIFLPFNAGPRICLGQQFAYNEMSFFLIRLLQKFSSISLDLTSLAPENHVPKEWATRPGRQARETFQPRSHLTMYALGGMWVKMTEATH